MGRTAFLLPRGENFPPMRLPPLMMNFAMAQTIVIFPVYGKFFGGFFQSLELAEVSALRVHCAA
jgi:hypothetical protein